MLTDLFPFLDPTRIPPELPARLRQLAADLANLRRVQLRAFALREAPLLEHWAAVLAPGGVCLIGQASGHPVLGDRPIITSKLYAADPDGRWVRTTSRFYRLGQPVDANRREWLTLVLDGDRAQDEDSAGEGRA